MTHLRLPDAILVASSLIANAPILVTHDDQLAKAQPVIRVLAAENALNELTESTASAASPPETYDTQNA